MHIYLVLVFSFSNFGQVKCQWDVYMMSRSSYERIMYVQFRSCIHWTYDIGLQSPIKIFDRKKTKV